MAVSVTRYGHYVNGAGGRSWTVGTRPAKRSSSATGSTSLL